MGVLASDVLSVKSTPNGSTLILFWNLSGSPDTDRTHLHDSDRAGFVAVDRVRVSRNRVPTRRKAHRERSSWALSFLGI